VEEERKLSPETIKYSKALKQTFQKRKVYPTDNDYAKKSFYVNIAILVITVIGVFYPIFKDIFCALIKK
jgi:hypothetical protein